MPPREILAKTLLRKHKRVDSWFVSSFGMNLYSGCGHDCAYCDGRAESYRVEGDFARDVGVKVNAPEILARELDPKRRRKPLRRGYVFLGGGVSDSYQPLEERYGITRQVLQLLLDFGYPVHVLTKSTLVERDLDLLQQINQRSRAVVSMSLSSVDDDIGRVFEPGCALPSARLASLRRIADAGLATGMYLLPVLPFVTDAPEQIAHAMASAEQAGVRFVVGGCMTLKEGRQRDHFTRVLQSYRPELEIKYRATYRGDRWGHCSRTCHDRQQQNMRLARRRSRLPQRMPSTLFWDLLDPNDAVCVVLDQMTELLRERGEPNNYRAAAQSIAALDLPITALRDKLRSIRGVGGVTERLIQELLKTGSARRYEDVLRGR